MPLTLPRSTILSAEVHCNDAQISYAIVKHPVFLSLSLGNSGTVFLYLHLLSTTCTLSKGKCRGTSTFEIYYYCLCFYCLDVFKEQRLAGFFSFFLCSWVPHIYVNKKPKPIKSGVRQGYLPHPFCCPLMIFLKLPYLTADDSTLHYYIFFSTNDPLR